MDVFRVAAVHIHAIKNVIELLLARISQNCYTLNAIIRYLNWWKVFEIFFFRDAKGRCPVLESLDHLPPEIEAKAWVRIEALEQFGNNLKRPQCDFLRDGIYELRFRHGKVQYRILYFFLNKGIVILSSLITKEKKVPPKEIDKCIANKKLVEADFELYTYSSEMQ